jgi:hypothetical protein
MRFRVPEIILGALLAVAGFAMDALFFSSFTNPPQRSTEHRTSAEQSAKEDVKHGFGRRRLMIPSLTSRFGWSPSPECWRFRPSDSVSLLFFSGAPVRSRLRLREMLRMLPPARPACRKRPVCRRNSLTLYRREKPRDHCRALCDKESRHDERTASE